MFKTEINGQEGYFLTKKEHQQLKNIIFKDAEEKVIQNANANNS